MSLGCVNPILIFEGDLYFAVTEAIVISTGRIVIQVDVVLEVLLLSYRVKISANWAGKGKPTIADDLQ